MRTHEENPFLQGNFSPVHDERADLSLEVIGQLPREIDGLFLRNGPNPRFTPIGTYHWFDGDGMMHAVRIKDGKASYKNRWVRTREFLIEEKEGKALWKGLEEPPDFNNPHGMMKNRSNTSAVFHAGKLLSIWEGGPPYELDPQTLETKGRFNYEGALKGAFTAHPKVDPITGEMFFFGYSPMPPYLRYYVVSPEGELEQSETIDVKLPVMMHDFAITEHYAIFMDLPAVMRPERLMKGKSFISWEPDKGARFGVMPRYGKASEVRWFEVPPFYMYHTANAYEEGGEIVITGGRMPGTFMIAQDAAIDESEQIESAEAGTMHRFRINLENGKTTVEKLDDAPIGFESVNEARLGRKARYNYATVMGNSKPNEGPQFIALRKYDLQTGTFATHTFEDGVLGGEGVFVPKHGATQEDEGFVLVLTHDTKTEQSELRVLDAQKYTQAPVARIVMKRRIPHGFHARFVPGSQLD